VKSAVEVNDDRIALRRALRHHLHETVLQRAVTAAARPRGGAG